MLTFDAFAYYEPFSGLSVHSSDYARGQAKVAKLCDLAKSFVNYLWQCVKRIMLSLLFDHWSKQNYLTNVSKRAQ